MFSELPLFTPAVFITIGLVAAVKRSQIFQDRFLPIFSIVFGGILGFVFLQDIIAGIVVGLTASGLYRGAKVTFLDE